MTARRTLLSLTWALSVTATQFASFTPPGDNTLTYSIHVPQDTATRGTGPIYIQLNATKELTWFALGQGTSMIGANMFVVYTLGNNVTISPRLGKGEIQPLYNENAAISTMNGTGIHDGVITANFRCDSCITWQGGRLDPNNSQSNWIWAVKYGKPLNSNSLSAIIHEHDSVGQEIVNLNQATGTSSRNPFLDLSSPTAGSAMDIGPQIDEVLDRKKKAHAVLMTLAFTLLFPCFALTLHLFPSGTVAIHGSLQLFTLAMAIAGMGVGISMAKDLQLLSHHHPVIGIVVVAGLTMFQPAMGWLQHRHFRKSGGKGPFAYLHRWFGRTMIVLGVINVGLGFQLTGIGMPDAPRAAVISYGVVAAVIGLVYITVVIVRRGRRVVK
ncbi:hypothetical protein N7448_001832 [Penicillium atrosanguineum]|uniref:Cellobiose dehydrogenase n=1 Tax=Penicillium atrosanguineum TaxID=1132637 RepID=A0A9W9LDX8_9EURO|nr:uncharacterized protein N7443_005230 [Penicillium atrosanguineum]KAJ5133138.1 hypothetical protein N7526_004503 [Penicillium atrosanguineum]KAJ5150254.1 hypothetical protein N7448_001832 [Penicillium atrosanguineum]KAJ5305570.1 hypothetical protein N7443_005230 [Penicillium atrosanguineum]KAJ5325032.1 hypothetical protein N7476_003632 [Penicillium atrosanguineum]